MKLDIHIDYTNGQFLTKPKNSIQLQTNADFEIEEIMTCRFKCFFPQFTWLCVAHEGVDKNC